jgi:hypothetical protein
MLAELLLLLVPGAHSQACACSRTTVLPEGSAVRPGEIGVAAEYTLGLSGDPDLWRGVAVKDRHGDSMAGMYMPPDLVHTAQLRASAGLPRGFSVALDMPWVVVDKLGVSDMPGDVDTRSVGDLAAHARWGRMPSEQTFAGLALAATFPTGEVTRGSMVRTGRGAVGLGGHAQAAWLAGPRLGVAASVGGMAGVAPDEDGYRLGPNLQGVMGARFSPRENGRFGASAYTILRWQGRDREDALVYDNSGYLCQEFWLGASHTVWARDVRSVVVSLRAAAPLWQVVGDPMYAQNFSVNAAISAVLR